MVRQTLSDADRLVVPSGPIRDLLQQRAPQTGHKWLPISLGVDTSLFSPSADKTRPSDNLFTFVAVGSIVPVKGYGLMLRSFARLITILERAAEGSARLLIVGSGPLEGRMRRAIHDLGLQGYVTLMGEVPHEHLPDLFRGAHSFLHTAWHEAQCMAALEAMSCGLPWIAPPVGIFPDVDRRGVNLSSGLCVEERTPNAFAEAMLKMVRMPTTERENRGELARTRTILRRYDLTKQAAMLATMLEIISQSTSNG
jgi:phosphatidylinositol alpha-1,6-mannosyltransferase